MGTIIFHMYSIVDTINVSFILFLRIFAYYPGSHSVSGDNNLRVCITKSVLNLLSSVKGFYLITLMFGRKKYSIQY